MSCIFCKIISGELPSHKVYEDENVLAFLDISPVNPGHTLVVPKKHFVDLEDADEATLCAVIKAVKRVGLSIKNNLGAAGYNLGMNNGAVAGQVVPHLHFHLMPRQAGDGLKLWPQQAYGPGEAEEILQKIKIF
ncbi:MAG: HIT family protein [Patescibacteria group bacterium]|nr:HIT family protein [Patescibacteria group bacterium]